MPRRRASYSMGRTPLTGRTDPSRESSPVMRASSVFSAEKRLQAERIPSAMGKSKAAPSFFVSAGARLTVIRLTGKEKPALRIAVRTRSRDSFTAESGRPTISKAGRPLLRSTSTSTG